MTIEFTKEEAQVLLQFIHIAVQARGLEAAEAAVVLSQKIKAAATEASTEAPKKAAEASKKDEK